ncbi:MAG: hypothetical protein OJF59_000626 [Cytophagales bacterium]|jgi:hypothetical protein|nr:MAG: hypothetical protein OJF59_000626 [Cytophagales bacterium]
MSLDVIISFSPNLKNQVLFKLNAQKINHHIISESDPFLISIDKNDFPLLQEICYTIKSDYVIIDSVDAPISNF